MSRKLTTGVLLINQGTPDRPEKKAIRRYLRQFLSDPRIMDIPVLLRMFLLYAIILPFRPSRSIKLYQKIWTASGSPLLVHTKKLSKEVQTILGDHFLVKPVMRYGNPSIESAIDELLSSGISELIVFPLYPQYASSTTGSVLQEVFRILGKKVTIPAVSTIGPFYDQTEFIQAFAKIGTSQIKNSCDHVIFTFHGLPERHIVNADASEQCLKKATCCDTITPKNQFCYRAQCFETARNLAEVLHIEKENYTVCFQSRMGRQAWIHPYTEDVLVMLPKKGVKNLVVFCPSFVADCLETLEEIAIRGKETFLAAGGESYVMVPSLNSDPNWCQTVAAFIVERLVMTKNSVK